MPIRTLFLSFAFAGIFSCTSSKKEGTIEDTSQMTMEPTVKTVPLISGYEVIWGMDFLPNGDLLFTEKKGKLHRKSGDKITEITGLPVINTSGQGGLLDVRVSPQYNSNGWIFISYAGNHPGGGGSFHLMRFKLVNDQITDSKILLSSNSANTMTGHYGSRIDFDEAGNLFVSVGEGGATSYGGANSPNKNAQDINSTWGKVHRITQDGGIPAGNPVLPGNTTPTTVYSYGHRNPQGLVYNPFTKDIWEAEHGPKGGDEVNIIKAGSNYGWPLVSYGVNYDDKPVSASPTMTGVTDPVHNWVPSIGACGMAFITDKKFKSWTGNLLVGGLALQYLARLEIKDNKVVKEHKLLDKVGRIRHVRQAPDGSIYVSIEGPGRIVRLVAE